jgi:probable DNA metabolism protein
MIIFVYDKTFEGLLTAVFDAYFRKTFPDMLLSEMDTLPLFYDTQITICSDQEKASRVWKALQKKLSKTSLSFLSVSWLSEEAGIDMLLFRYIRKVVDSPHSIEMNFGDPDILAISKIWKKVQHESSYIQQFLRFQKAADDTYFACIEPLYNALPLVVNFLKNRFHDQKWLVYDIKRNYGYYYDTNEVLEVTLNDRQWENSKLKDELMDNEEKMFQQLWQQYFKSITIKERINPRLQKQHMPIRFWKYLTEKQK